MNRALIFAFLALVLALGEVACNLTQTKADAIETSASIGCDLVDLWCDPTVLPEAPERWCGLAVGLCRTGQAGLTYVLPQFTERTLALSAVAPDEGEPTAPTLTACLEWGYWCAHTEAAGAEGVCGAVEHGCREHVAVTVTVVPAAKGEGAGD